MLELKTTYCTDSAYKEGASAYKGGASAYKGGASAYKGDASAYKGDASAYRGRRVSRNALGTSNFGELIRICVVMSDHTIECPFFIFGARAHDLRACANCIFCIRLKAR